MGFEEFCGGEFWSLDSIWHTKDPDFTPCFQHTALAWIPGAFLILSVPFEFAGWFNSRSPRIPFTVLNIAKLLVTIGLVAVGVAEIVNLTKYDSPDTKVSDAQYVGEAVMIVSYLFSALILVISLRKGCITSGPQFIFWLLDSVCRAINLRTAAKAWSGELKDDDFTTTNFILSLLHLIFSVIMIFLNFFADKMTDEEFLNSRKPCPNYDSSFINKIFYVWATPLMWRGFRNPLTMEDLWDISPKVASKTVVPEFLNVYEEAVSKSKSKIESSASKSSDGQKPKPKVSIFPALMKVYGGSFLFGSLLKIIVDLLNLASPKIMKMMIQFVESYSTDNVEQQEEWKGYFYVALLFCTLTLQSLLTSQYFERMFVIGVKVRTVLVAALYKKSLKISSAAKKESTVGEIVNLMSVDVQKFMDLLPYVNVLWSSLLQIALATYFIYQELGWPAFIGVGILFISMPLNGYLASLMRKFQLQQMKLKDKRIKMMNEILGGIKVLKLYAWEPSFINQIGTVRNDEIKVMKKAAYFNAFMSFFWTTAPFLVGLGAFTAYIFKDGGQILEPTQAFVTLSYLNLIRIPLAILPMMIAFLVQAKVSLDRVNKFMNNEELDEEAVTHLTGKSDDKGDAVTINNATFKWGPDEPRVLSDIDIKIKKGSLTAVVGAVGCGKSSLISAILGDLEKEKGAITTSGSIAYVAQQAWIQNSTLKDNILFCKDYVQKIYERTIDACALKTDLEILPAGDQTEIGEKGINLSGGQKQRVSLARAVYSDHDLFLLDDPLSAVDSHVGKHIFENVIGPGGVLQNKTRVLVTHGVTYLPKTDYIIVLKDGKVSEQGSFKDLVEQKGEFANFILEYMSEASDAPDEVKEQLTMTLGENFVKRQISTQQSVVSNDGTDEKKKPVEKKKEEEPKVGEKLIEKENAETGRVKLEVYGYYMKCLGIFGSLAALIGQTLYSGSNVMISYWLTWWTSGAFGNATEKANQDMYLGVYGGLGLIQALVVMSYTAVLALATLNASKLLHKKMLIRVMRAPMSFFDTTPLGRIVNRFAKDVDVCDQTLPQNLRSWLSQFGNFLATIITIMTVIWQFIIVIIPVSFGFYFVQTFYVTTSRQLKRLESISRSPIYSHFGETITGSSTIRAFKREKEFMLESANKVDNNQVAYYPSIITNRWLAIWLELLGNIVTLGAALFVILSPSSFNSSQVGLVITYSLNITQTLNWLVRMTADVETNIVGVERIKEYSEIEQESPWRYPGQTPGREWPESGKVEFSGYGLRYREGLDLVIKDITATVSGGEKVGIVGRTGAGKSTLTVALFRLVEAAQGDIKIDGKTISELGLHDLREKLTIIPQDPVLFSGTLRMNLDPFSHYSDQQVWAALEQAHLKSYVTELEKGLDHEVQEGGENLSVGQRQLVCLARALLRKTKVLILDEATAAVDLETDDLIQDTIRKEFATSSVLTIAHRLNTIMDYDRIMVLDKGELREYNSPNKLLQNPDSIFYGMVKDAGLLPDQDQENTKL